MTRVRVLIVEDSLVVSTFLEHVIDADPRLRVAGVATTAERALELMPKLRPDVVLMDVRLPGMDGVEATRRIMQTQPTPIVVASAALADPTLQISMNALKAGALAVIEKPPGPGRDPDGRQARRLCTQLFIMSQLKVVRQRPIRPLAEPPPPPEIFTHEPAVPPRSPGEALPFDMLGLVASTGGPNALAQVLGALPADFPLPVTLVQHIGAEFAEGFAGWLGTQVRLPTNLAVNGERARPGHIHVAPGNCHLTVRSGIIVLTDTPPVSGQKPSGTVLLNTLAECYGARAIGVVLTGMGDDGAEGLLAMRRAGAYTIAEDESTAIVYGMPGVAARLGAARAVLPLEAIGARILTMAGLAGTLT